jgi:hypothetical protein
MYMYYMYMYGHTKTTVQLLSLAPSIPHPSHPQPDGTRMVPGWYPGGLLLLLLSLAILEIELWLYKIGFEFKDSVMTIMKWGNS